MSLLEVKDLKVRVEEREILHGLTLTVNPGEVQRSWARTAPANRR